jgi:hypothetical protein
LAIEDGEVVPVPTRGRSRSAKRAEDKEEIPVPKSRSRSKRAASSDAEVIPQVKARPTRAAAKPSVAPEQGKTPKRRVKSVEFIESIKIPDHMEKPKRIRKSKSALNITPEAPGMKLTPSRLRKAIAAA